MMRRAALAAWVCAGLHVLAAAGMLFLLRPGLPPEPPPARWMHLTEHGTAWTLGWAAWMAAAVSLVAAWVLLGIRGWPLWLTVAAVAPDFAAELIYILKYPHLSPGAYADGDRLNAVLSGFIANGSYTAAWAGIAFRPDFPRGLRPLAVLGIAAGAALAAGSLLHFVPLMVASTALLLPVFTAWLTLAGCFFWKRPA